MYTPGSGQLMGAKLAPRLLEAFRAPPTRLGGLDELPISLSEAGQPLATLPGGEQVEVALHPLRTPYTPLGRPTPP